MEVVGPTKDRSRIWKDDVDFFETPKLAGRFKGFLRSSPGRLKRDGDGELILDLLRQAEANPVTRPVDPKKLARMPWGE